MLKTEKILRVEIKEIQKKMDENLKKMRLIVKEAKKGKRAGQLKPSHAIEKEENLVMSLGQENIKIGSLLLEKFEELITIKKIKNQN